MDFSHLQGVQYARLAPGAAQTLAPYLDAMPDAIDELVLDLAAWPPEIRPSPRRTRDGRLMAGDPLLLGADDRGLRFAPGSQPPADGQGVLVRWSEVRLLEALAPLAQRVGA